MSARGTASPDPPLPPGQRTSPIGRPAIAWHARSAVELLGSLATDGANGLSGAEAARRLAADGANRLADPPRQSRLLRLWQQLNSLLVWVLVGAALIAGLLGEWIDTGAILAIVALNAIIGYTQEQRAEQALNALRTLAMPTSRVVRDGRVAVIPTAALVVGDLIEIEAGDRVPADARLMLGYGLSVDEASLTGESLPVEKAAEAELAEETPLAERLTMVYSGTVVTTGRATGIVTATGMATELGRLASLVATAGTEATPLQRRLAYVSRWLIVAALAVCIGVFGLGVLRGIEPAEMFLTAVSLAVAAVPEGLPAVVTIVLALGTQRMARRKAIIRRLPAVETLGGTTIICTDKTGTLTQNRMAVRALWTPGQASASTVPGHGRLALPAAETGLLRGALLASAVHVTPADDDGQTAELVGDPTETALFAAAQRAGLPLSAAGHGLIQIGELPFDSTRKRMSRLYVPLGVSPDSGVDETIAYVKGAPEAILARSTSQFLVEGIQPLDEAGRQAARASNDALAAHGLRLLAVAVRTASPRQGVEAIEDQLTLLGLVGLQDPPRPEVMAAVAECRAAGIRPVMITGDQVRTAEAIGRELGLLDPGDAIMTGAELDNFDDQNLIEVVPRVRAYARVTGEHKLRIVRAWRARGEVVAMTGDGVNDAPALREADIGVAMGITGTDVTREAGDVVLADDNFATIVAAVEEGRVIADNIRKVLRYLLSCNVGEIMVMLGAVLFGWPLPLLAVQILWMNLVTDSLPALALGQERAEPGVMRRQPERPGAPLLRPAAIRDLLIESLLMATTALTAFAIALSLGWSIEVARTLAFTTLVLAQLVQALNCRSEIVPLFRLGFGSNRALLLGIGVALMLQLLIVYHPWAGEVFGTVPLAAGELALSLGLALLIWPAVELRKQAIRYLAWLH